MGRELSVRDVLKLIGCLKFVIGTLPSMLGVLSTLTRVSIVNNDLHGISFYSFRILPVIFNFRHSSGCSGSIVKCG
jgi:hypothetical protein